MLQFTSARECLHANVGPRRCSGGGGGACAVVITSATDGQTAADLEHHLVDAAENSRGVFTIQRHPGDPREGPSVQPALVYVFVFPLQK